MTNLRIELDATNNEWAEMMINVPEGVAIHQALNDRDYVTAALAELRAEQEVEWPYDARWDDADFVAFHAPAHIEMPKLVSDDDVESVLFGAEEHFGFGGEFEDAKAALIASNGDIWEATQALVF